MNAVSSLSILAIAYCVLGMVAGSPYRHRFERKGLHRREGKSCTYGNLVHQDGESFLRNDGCNTCRCHDGKVLCTRKFCPLVDDETKRRGIDFKKREGKSCTHGSAVHQDGESFQHDDGCNRCRCNDGKIVCTWKICPQNSNRKREGTSCTYNNVVRQDGESFVNIDGCNRCRCTNGKVACTRKFCPPTEPKTRGLGYEMREGKSCTHGSAVHQDGESFQHDDGCNRCRCNDGKILCTWKICPSTDTRSHESATKQNSNQKREGTSCTYNNVVHQDGESFMHIDGCNRCRCTNGKVPCTRKFCPPADPKTRGLGYETREGKSCTHGSAVHQDGESFQHDDGCNRCRCNDGKIVCTWKICPSTDTRSLKMATRQNSNEKREGTSCTYNNVVRQDGESFMHIDGCNRCRCINGKVLCTKKFCSPTEPKTRDYIE